jgi:hypothetical protein
MIVSNLSHNLLRPGSIASPGGLKESMTASFVCETQAQSAMINSPFLNYLWYLFFKLAMTL